MAEDKEKSRSAQKELKVKIREGNIKHKYKLEQKLIEGDQKSLKRDEEYTVPSRNYWKSKAKSFVCAIMYTNDIWF